MSNGKQLTVSVAEAAEMLGVSINQAYKAAHEGDIPTIRVGARILVPRAALLRMVGVDDSAPTAS